MSIQQEVRIQELERKMEDVLRRLESLAAVGFVDRRAVKKHFRKQVLPGWNNFPSASHGDDAA